MRALESSECRALFQELAWGVGQCYAVMRISDSPAIYTYYTVKFKIYSQRPACSFTNGI